MKKVIIASITAFAFAATAMAAGYTFSNYLTVGSTGADVSALQTWLIANHFNIPSIQSGAAQTGYFGQQTKAAVIQYQASVGLPATGFVGPLTVAKLNANATVGTTIPTQVMCPVGYNCTPIAGTPGTGTPGTVTGPTGISTPGVPGILSVTTGPLSSSVLNVGQQMVPVLSIRVQAQYSDLSVQSLNLDLGNNTAIFNKIFNKIYVTDGTNVLASQVLNSSTVIQSGSTYIVGLAGFNFIVPKGTYRDLIIKADLNSSIDSTYLSGGSRYPGTNGIAAVGTSPFPTTGWAVGLAANGLRAVDGAGINLNGPSTEIAQSLVINSSLVDTAQANLSADGSIQTNAFSVTDTANGNYLGLPVLSFSVYAQNDTLHLHQIVANITNAGGGTVSAAYLFQGSTQVASASVSGGVATFSNITDGTNGATIPMGTSQTYTIKVDVTGVTTSPARITASLAAGSQVIYNSIDSNVTVSGNPTGNQQTINGVGPSFSLTSNPSITTQGTNQTGTTLSTSTIVASFPLNISSVGADTYFGTVASSSGVVANTGGPSFDFKVLDSTNSVVYEGYGQGTNIGVISNSGNLSGTKVILPTLPTQVTPGGIPTNTFVVPNQANVSLGTVQFQFDGKNQAGQALSGGPYKVNLSKIRYQTTTSGVLTVATSSFMDNLAAWTTNGQNP